MYNNRKLLLQELMNTHVQYIHASHHRVNQMPLSRSAESYVGEGKTQRRVQLPVSITPPPSPPHHLSRLHPCVLLLDPDDHEI